MSKIDDLFIQMNPKRQPIELTANSESKETIYNSTITEQIDYYAILGLKRDASKTEVKKAYQTKLKQFHPDKTEPTKENKLKYKLIREAGDMLSHSQKRKAYDTQYKLNSMPRDFISQRNSFNEFIKLQEQNVTDDDIKTARLNFDKSIQHMNKNHESNLDMKPLSQDEYIRKMEDLILQREQEGFEITHDNMFDGKQFNRNEFNNIFEKKKLKDTINTSDSIVLFKDGISAYNSDSNEGTSLDNRDSLYANGKYNEYNEKYAGINSGLVGNDDNIDSSNDDDLSIDSPDADDDDDDNDNDNNYNNNDYKEDFKVSNILFDTKVKNMLSERDSYDNKFKNMTDADYGSTLDDDFGISKQFGFMVGNDRYGHQITSKNKLTKSNIKIYKELTQE